MSEEYRSYCMKFSNKELFEFFYKELNRNWNFKIKCLSEEEEEIDFESSKKIETIIFGENNNIAIMFFEYQTSIFVYEKEIMFIDESTKGVYTSSDVYSNVVYEGKLREMSHEQMLKMFSDIILCFFNATSVCVIQEEIPAEKKYNKYNYYDPYMFVINVQNNNIERKVKVFENITINY